MIYDGRSQKGKKMLCISLNKQINCEFLCKSVFKYVEENVKSQEQAKKTILKISLVESSDYEEIKKLEDKTT